MPTPVPRVAAALTLAAPIVLVAGCGTPETSRTLLSTERASVCASVGQTEAAWRVREIRALARGDAALNALEVRAFLDANGNDELDEGEGFAAWRTSSPVPSRGFELAGHLAWEACDARSKPLLRLRTSLTYDDGEIEREVVAPLE